MADGSGVSTPRAASRSYTDEDRAEFFRRLELVGNVSKVAKELGFVRVTCYKWAHQAGIFTGKDTAPQRVEFARLRAEGVSRTDAAKAVGVDKRPPRTGTKASDSSAVAVGTPTAVSFAMGRRRHLRT